MDWSKAIGNLEHANKALIGCSDDDFAGLESAMSERDVAVQAISELDPRDLPAPLAECLRAAFDTGAAIRARVAAIYRDTHVELQRTQRLRHFVESGQH
jgi:hypothetical protein